MIDINEIYDTVIDTFKKLLFPEEWINVDLNLSKTELFTLLQVERNGEIIMSQIANYINIPMSTATGMAERLLKKGYIERTRSESDRRVVSIRLTETGKQLTEAIRKRIFDIAKQVLEELTEEEERLLFRIFSKAIGIITSLNGSEGEEGKNQGSVIKKIEIE